MISNIHQRLRCDAQLAVFSNSFMWLTAVLPYLVVAERYFAGEIEFGVISQVTASVLFCVRCFRMVELQRLPSLVRTV